MDSNLSFTTANPENFWSQWISFSVYEMTIIALSAFKITCLCCHGSFEEEFNVYFLLQSLVPGIKWIRIILTCSVKLSDNWISLSDSSPCKSGVSSGVEIQVYCLFFRIISVAVQHSSYSPVPCDAFCSHLCGPYRPLKNKGSIFKISIFQTQFYLLNYCILPFSLRF